MPPMTSREKTTRARRWAEQVCHAAFVYEQGQQELPPEDYNPLGYERQQQLIAAQWILRKTAPRGRKK